jgi:hypothetical protein
MADITDIVGGLLSGIGDGIAAAGTASVKVHNDIFYQLQFLVPVSSQYANRPEEISYWNWWILLKWFPVVISLGVVLIEAVILNVAKYSRLTFVGLYNLFIR